jgi:hypothetical protein
VREVVDQWRKSGADRFQAGTGLAIALVAALGSFAGCAARQPVQAVDAERRCEWAGTLSASGKLAAAMALQDSDDDDLKLGIGVALAGVDGAVRRYCGAVRAGRGSNAEIAALSGLRAALDELTSRTLAPAPTFEGMSQQTLEYHPLYLRPSS